MGDGWRALRAGEFDSIDEVVVLAEGHLIGMVPLDRLVGAPDSSPIAAVMDADPPVIRPDSEEEAAAWALVDRAEASIAMVDDGGRFVGIVPAHRVVDALLRAYDEQLARLGGYVAGATRAREAAEESLWRRLVHRLPWLIVGLVGAMISAVIVGAFEAQLDEVVLLAFFLPAVVYMSGAVSTQTVTVLIRGLAVGIDMRLFLMRELVTGALLGAAIGVVFFPFALIGWGDFDVAVAIALALFVTCSTASIVAMALPWTLQRLGRDPAFGSGPVATIIQDLLSIAVYLLIAAPIVG